MGYARSSPLHATRMHTMLLIVRKLFARSLALLLAEVNIENRNFDRRIDSAVKLDLPRHCANFSGGTVSRLCAREHV